MTQHLPHFLLMSLHTMQASHYLLTLLTTSLDLTESLILLDCWQQEIKELGLVLDVTWMLSCETTDKFDCQRKCRLLKQAYQTKPRLCCHKRAEK